MLDRLANDDRLPLDRAALAKIVATGEHASGAAADQVAAFVAAVEPVLAAHPHAATYQPGDIL